MIFVTAGTHDGRDLVGQLLTAGYEVTASVVSDYGEELLRQCGNSQLIINDQPMDETALLHYLSLHDIALFVDASHPYAVKVSQNAMNACRRLNLPYIRYERCESLLVYDKLYLVSSYDDAAHKAAELGKNIFLTTGSRNLSAFIKAPCLAEHTLTVRVLPVPEVIDACGKMGFTPKNIIAMQGPFSIDLNKELFKQYKADVIVMKNSGPIGGTDTKLAAAVQLSLPIVVIERPKLEYDHLATSFDEVLDFAERSMAKRRGK